MLGYQHEALAGSATACPPGGRILRRYDTTASGFSQGVDISGKMGIDLSARSGYTVKVRITVAFTKAGKLCGVKDVPAENPGSLVVR